MWCLQMIKQFFSIFKNEEVSPSNENLFISQEKLLKDQ